MLTPWKFDIVLTVNIVFQPSFFSWPKLRGCIHPKKNDGMEHRNLNLSLCPNHRQISPPKKVTNSKVKVESVEADIFPIMSLKVAPPREQSHAPRLWVKPENHRLKTAVGSGDVIVPVGRFFFGPIYGSMINIDKPQRMGCFHPPSPIKKHPGRKIRAIQVTHHTMNPWHSGVARESAGFFLHRTKHRGIQSHVSCFGMKLFGGFCCFLEVIPSHSHKFPSICSPRD